MTKRAARGLAAAIDNLGTEHRQFHQPDRRLARILREVCRSEWPATPPCLDAAELCGIWRVLAGIDARVTLARYSESSRFPHEHFADGLQRIRTNYESNTRIGQIRGFHSQVSGDGQS